MGHDQELEHDHPVDQFLIESLFCLNIIILFILWGQLAMFLIALENTCLYSWNWKQVKIITRIKQFKKRYLYAKKI